MRNLILSAILISFASCEGGWSSEDKENYLTTCKTQAEQMTTPENAVQYCNCALETLTRKYPAFNDMLEHMDSVLKDEDLYKCKEDAGIVSPGL